MNANNAALLRAMPWVFVVIWSTGFVAARLGMPHAGPMGFLAWRFGLSVLVFLLWARWARAPWPQGRAQWAHLGATGLLIHAGYLGGVWVAVKGGLGAGLAALIVGLQPVLTAVWLSASARSHRVSARQWLGLLMGLAGLALVVGQKLQLGVATTATVGWAALALVSITTGTLYQKRWLQPCDVRSASVVQLLAAFAVTLPLALLEAEPMRTYTHPHPQLLVAMVWSVLVLTLGGSSLLYLLIQRGAATSVTSLMYLVPPCAALMAWVLFDEPLTAVVLAGLAITALGVAIVMRAKDAVPAPAAAQAPLP